jgi:hypothetical protein
MAIKAVQTIVVAGGVPFSYAKQDQIFKTVLKFLEPFAFREVARTVHSLKGSSSDDAVQSNLRCTNKSKVGSARIALTQKLAKAGFSEPKVFSNPKGDIVIVWTRKNISVLLAKSGYDGEGSASIRLYSDPRLALDSPKYLRSEFEVTPIPA